MHRPTLFLLFCLSLLTLCFSTPFLARDDAAPFVCSPSCAACTATFSDTDDGDVEAREIGLFSRKLQTPQDDYGGSFIQFFRLQTRASFHANQGLDIARISGTGSTAVSKEWSAPFNLWVAGLYGCTSVAVVSQQGVWMSHFWEDKGFHPELGGNFQANVLDAMRNGDGKQMEALYPLAGEGKILHSSQRPQIMIMTPWTKDKSDLLYREYINQIKSALTTDNDAPFKGAPVNEQGYVKPSDMDPEPSPEQLEELMKNNANGKMLVQFDNDQDPTNNPKQESIWRVYMEDNKPIEKTWQPGCPNNQKRDDGGACTSVASSSANTSVASSSASMSTTSESTAAVSTSAASTTSAASATAAQSTMCTYQDGTPEQKEGCLCSSGSSTITVVPMTPSSASNPSQSCAFSTWPGASPTVADLPRSVTTYYQACQVCTVVGENEDDCSPLTSCTASTTRTVLSAATGAVSVGTLTGSAFYAAVTSAIDHACQVPTAGGAGTYTCDEKQTVTIASNIHYSSAVADVPQWLDDGKLTLQMQETNYDSLIWYTEAKAAVAALAQNSTQGNCQDVTVTPPNTGHHWRRVGPNLPREDSKPRGMFGGPSTTNVCSVGSAFQVLEIIPGNTGAVREMSFNLQFKDGSDGDIFCQFIEQALESVEIAINAATDSEAALPRELEINQMVLDACEGKPPDLPQTF